MPSPSPSVGGPPDVGGLLLTGLLLPVVATLTAAFIVWLLGRLLKRHPFLAIGRGTRAAWRWVRGVQVFVTGKRWQRRYDDGYAKRSEEVTAERAISLPPSWSVRRAPGRQEFTDGADLWLLDNRGYRVRDVRLTGDSDLFVFEHEAFFGGDFGDDMPGSSTGKLFDGRLTDRGRAEGVDFKVEWRDRAGDPKAGTVNFPPQSEPIESAEAAYLRGRAEERQEATRRAGVVIEPRWTVSGLDGYNFVLENLVPDSVADEVRVNAIRHDFVVLSAAHWPSVRGGSQVVFQGQVQTDHVLGPLLAEVVWSGVDGKRYRTSVPIRLS